MGEIIRRYNNSCFISNESFDPIVNYFKISVIIINSAPQQYLLLRSGVATAHTSSFWYLITTDLIARIRPSIDWRLTHPPTQSFRLFGIQLREALFALPSSFAVNLLGQQPLPYWQVGQSKPCGCFTFACLSSQLAKLEKYLSLFVASPRKFSFSFKIKLDFKTLLTFHRSWNFGR